MFNDLNQVDWQALGASQVPEWIKGLVSEHEKTRIESFDALLDTYVYELPAFSQYVVIYIIRILESQEVNSQTEWLITFLKNMRINAQEYLKKSLAVETSKRIISDIDQSINVFKRLLENPFTKDASKELIAEIENLPM